MADPAVELAVGIVTATLTEEDAALAPMLGEMMADQDLALGVTRKLTSMALLGFSYMARDRRCSVVEVVADVAEAMRAGIDPDDPPPPEWPGWAPDEPPNRP